MKIFVIFKTLTPMIDLPTLDWKIPTELSLIYPLVHRASVSDGGSSSGDERSGLSGGVMGVGAPDVRH